jgi:endonuclease YncB( thermonuclease family)
MLHRILHICAVCLLCLSATAWAAPAWQARIVDVADGDTLTAEPVNGGDRVKIRLYGIDAPERKQPYGERARDYVVKAALYKQATIQPQAQGRDRYGRVVGTVILDGANALQEGLLASGLAWVYRQYCKDCRAWEAIQSKAKASRTGLWADRNAIPPWEWRKAARK